MGKSPESASTGSHSQDQPSWQNGWQRSTEKAFSQANMQDFALNISQKIVMKAESI